MTLVYECYSPEELSLDEVFVNVLHREIDRGSRDAFFARFQTGLSLTQARSTCCTASSTARC